MAGPIRTIPEGTAHEVARVFPTSAGMALYFPIIKLTLSAGQEANESGHPHILNIHRKWKLEGPLKVKVLKASTTCRALLYGRFRPSSRFPPG